MAKPRVHELAKELGITSKEAISTLQTLGEFVRGASSTVEPPVAKKLRSALAGRAEKSAPAAPSTLLDLLPRCRQPSLPQHRQILSRCVHGAAPEAVLFCICSTYLSQLENKSPVLYSDFLSWLRSCVCPVRTFRSAMARSTLYSQCLCFSPFIFHTS